MSRPAIIVDDIGKRYRIGRAARKDTFREAMAAAIQSPMSRLRDPLNGSAGTEDFWALKGVSFEVQPGEVIGIIGRNGAGKSTLLKILSRITEPTEGCIRLRGRIASLLEVGTGFHPDLTGRENIYLNGSILGMGKAEITRKFDEIVAFAEIERFLDTQVKHYSSGMYVRLAFAVAAHLDPEILVVDEVLAVGDSGFQKKCLGKMRQVAGGGRTVLFVSHNMPTVIQLCQRALLMKGGRLSMQGVPEEIVQHYHAEDREDQGEVRDLSRLKRVDPGHGGARLVSCRMTAPDRAGHWAIPFGSPVSVAVAVVVTRHLQELEFGLSLCNSSGLEVASALSSDVSPRMTLAPGEYTFAVALPTLRLAPGLYQLNFGLRSDRGMEDLAPEAAFFEVLPNSKSSEALVHHRSGAIIPDLEFSVENPIASGHEQATLLLELEGQ